jgi:hypothetical protein
MAVRVPSGYAVEDSEVREPDRPPTTGITGRESPMPSRSFPMCKTRLLSDWELVVFRVLLALLTPASSELPNGPPIVNQLPLGANLRLNLTNEPVR